MPVPNVDVVIPVTIEMQVGTKRFDVTEPDDMLDTMIAIEKTDNEPFIPHAEEAFAVCNAMSEVGYLKAEATKNGIGFYPEWVDDLRERLIPNLKEMIRRQNKQKCI